MALRRVFGGLAAMLTRICAGVYATAGCSVAPIDLTYRSRERLGVIVRERSAPESRVVTGDHSAWRRWCGCA